MAFVSSKDLSLSRWQPGGADAGDLRVSTLTSVPNLVTAEPVASATAVLEVRLPARYALLPTVLTIAADLAHRAELTADAVDEFQMAVDEACRPLIPLARPGSLLSCDFVSHERGLEFTATVSSGPPHALDVTGVGWHILCTLTDELNVLSPGGRTGIRLTKHRTYSDVRDPNP